MQAELVFVVMGFVLALCVGASGACWWLLRAARETEARVREREEQQLATLREAAGKIAEAHNNLVSQVAEHAQSIERLKAETAGRALGRVR